jgi:hypothetical protein
LFKGQTECVAKSPKLNNIKAALTALAFADEGLRFPDPRSQLRLRESRMLSRFTEQF